MVLIHATWWRWSEVWDARQEKPLISRFDCEMLSVLLKIKLAIGCRGDVISAITDVTADRPETSDSPYQRAGFCEAKKYEQRRERGILAYQSDMCEHA